MRLDAIPIGQNPPHDVNVIIEVPLGGQQIEHFFEHYKDLEEGKWVKIGDWGNAEQARRTIAAAIERALE